MSSPSAPDALAHGRSAPRSARCRRHVAAILLAKPTRALPFLSPVLHRQPPTTPVTQGLTDQRLDQRLLRDRRYARSSPAEHALLAAICAAGARSLQRIRRRYRNARSAAQRDRANAYAGLRPPLVVGGDDGASTLRTLARSPGNARRPAGVFALDARDTAAFVGGR